MMIPLYVLAAGAVLAGMIWYGSFIEVDYHGTADWWGGAIGHGEGNEVLHHAHDVPSWVKVSPFVAMLLGLAIAYYMYILRPETPAKLARQHAPLYQFLLNKWYFDEVYDFLFVRPAMWIGRTLWRRGDGATIDGFLNGLAMGIVPWLTRFAGRIQSGYLFHYAFVMLIGISLLITWFAVGGGH